ncbi:hypothetical protein AAEO56_08100 [Flavobacterium sp. DGU11]|uniref:SMODS and SLOG-associating 2TM effector domain-containing protein n=1 Tax=Flavobacterium arundinis TaxID=3139143 RepID=A0ABU9HVN0_9FLAO
MRDRFWATFINYKYKGFVIELLYCKYQRWERNINVFLAIASSSSIAAWALWKELDWLWAGIIASSQLINAIKPFFPYNKYVKELGSKFLKMENLTIECEKLWDKIQNDTITEEETSKKYYEFKKESSDILRFSDDIIFDVSKQSDIENKATELNKNFFRTHYNVELK